MTGHDEAIAAIQAELGPDRPLAAFPPDIRERVAGFVTEGLCTVAQAAEALAVATELAVAAERGELDEAQGVEVMTRLGLRHRDGGSEA